MRRWRHRSRLQHTSGGNAKTRCACSTSSCYLFAPLGISNYYWWKYPNGTVQMGGGLSIQPRDMAKIGALMLRGHRRAGVAVRPFPCPAGSAEPPPARLPLTASALRAEVPGHTFYWDAVNLFPWVFGGHHTMFVATDGGLYGTFKGPDGSSEDDVGRWRITPEERFAAPGTCGTAGENTALPYTGKARTSNSLCKTDSEKRCTDVSPATPRAIEPYRIGCGKLHGRQRPRGCVESGDAMVGTRRCAAPRALTSPYAPSSVQSHGVVGHIHYQ